MDILIHTPRKTEAKISPEFKTDIIINPRFYNRKGTVPVFYFSVIDVRGNTDNYVLTINAATKFVKVEKLIEVQPLCDVDNKEELIKEKEDVGQSDQVYATNKNETI